MGFLKGLFWVGWKKSLRLLRFWLRSLWVSSRSFALFFMYQHYYDAGVTSLFFLPRYTLCRVSNYLQREHTIYSVVH